VNIKVLISDDHKIIRQGLRSLLEGNSQITIVGEANSGRETVELSQKLSPSIIVMDVEMPDLNGIEATRQIIKQNKNARIIALSMHTDKQYVARMLEAGAKGYLPKDCALEELEKAIFAVADNRTYLSPRVADVVVKDYVVHLSSKKALENVELSPREKEVIQLLAEGKSAKEIAYTLHVSAKTVETHRKNIMEKLGVHSIAELTKCAIRRGLTSLDT
jgi:two-component system, NarL family, response regulator NreC